MLASLSFTPESQNLPVTAVNTQETWKDVVGFEGSYRVSNLGRVASLRGRYRANEGTMRILNPGLTSWGYLRVNLSFKNKPSLHKVHKLVALAFVPNPHGKPEINHKDFNKQNNRAENLEWVTSEENNLHYTQSGRRFRQRISS